LHVTHPPTLLAHPRPGLPLSVQPAPPPRHLHSFPTRRSSDLLPQLHIQAAGDAPCFHSLPSAAQSARWSRSSREPPGCPIRWLPDRKSTRLNSSHVAISYAVFCLKKKKWADDRLKWGGA